MIKNVIKSTLSSLQVISVYMGTTVNLVEWWDTYKAAKAALTNTLQPNNIKSVAAKNGARLEVKQDKALKVLVNSRFVFIILTIQIITCLKVTIFL